MSSSRRSCTTEPKSASEIVGSVPRDLEKIILRCLRKDPARRLQHMDDVKNLLEELKEDVESGKVYSQDTRRQAKRGPFVGIAAVLLFTGATGGVAWWWSKGRLTQPRQPVLTRLTSDSGLTIDPALSADGKLLAYASDRAGEDNLEIWVRHVAEGESVRLTNNPADDHEPSFSPDGSQIAFRSERNPPGVYLTSSLGGEATLVANDGRNPRYSPTANGSPVGLVRQPTVSDSSDSHNWRASAECSSFGRLITPPFLRGGPPMGSAC